MTLLSLLCYGENSKRMSETGSSPSHKTVVVLAVAATAASTLVLAVIVFCIVLRVSMAERRRRRDEFCSSFRREPVSWQEYSQQGGALRGGVVDENGLDVLYMRKLEGGQYRSCFSKVWFNNMEEEEEEKRMDSGGDEPKISNPIQEIPFLHDPSQAADFSRTQESLSKTINPVLPMANSLPPPPPPPPPQPSASPSFSTKVTPKPPPPPTPANRKPPVPPQQFQAGGLVSSSKPPTAPKGKAEGHGRAEAKPAESLTGVEVQRKMKPLHWDKVTANVDHSMVWDEITDGSFRFDDDLIEALFGYTASNQKSPENNNAFSISCGSNTAQLNQIFILDPRKSQNTAIVLKSLAISMKEIIDSVLDGRGLNADTLEKLTKISPTQEETAKLLQFIGDPLKLADAEFFLYNMLKAVPSAFIHINAMLFRSNYDPDILYLKESLQTLESGCKELRTRGIFFKLLEAILKAGNCLNAGTARGNAQGFNLSALQKLSYVKSTNGKTTLLHFVVEQVIRSEGERCVINQKNHIFSRTNRTSSESDATSKEEREREYLRLGLPVLEGLSTDFSNVKKAAAIDYDCFSNMHSALTVRATEIGELVVRCNNVESGGFVKEMKGFLEECEDELRVVREEQSRLIELVKKTTEYYQAGASKDKGAHPLQIFVVVKDFLGMVDQVCIDIKRKLQKKSAIPSLSSPPLSPSTRISAKFQNLQSYFMPEKPKTSFSSESEDDF